MEPLLHLRAYPVSRAPTVRAITEATTATALTTTATRKKLTPAVLEGSFAVRGVLGGPHANPKAYGPSGSTHYDTTI